MLRGAKDAAGWSLEQLAQLARDAAGDDPDRAALVQLIEHARQLRGAIATVAR